MYQITVFIPDEFLQPLDEMVNQASTFSQTGPLTRDEFVKNLIRGAIFDYQMRKDFQSQQQQRAMQLMSLWP